MGHQRHGGFGLAQVKNFVVHAGRATLSSIYGVPRNLLVAESTMPPNVVQPIAIAALGAVPPGRPAKQMFAVPIESIQGQVFPTLASLEDIQDARVRPLARPIVGATNTLMPAGQRS